MGAFIDLEIVRDRLLGVVVLLAVDTAAAAVVATIGVEAARVVLGRCFSLDFALAAISLLTAGEARLFVDALAGEVAPVRRRARR